MILQRTPPPLYFLAALIIGVGANILFPLRIGSQDWLVYSGWGMIVAGILVMPSVLLSFRGASTPFDVRRDPTALLVTGPYRLSRNPSYLALLISYMGIGIVLGNAWMLLTGILAIVLVDVFVVRNEERQLEVVFGDTYLAYKSRVRRWL
ncbi:MAG: isoprenylcysteine carboxylmethyltransferase family protein [Gammaproteobacteria bacterium]|nr:isoprenylcysteine carboxylmethyltransferase family protein [Gammaproteobacteria bacterium]MCZ6659289.1 isoprenylcysteine carboxylmethyltransferase family protein [Gammaproteobacteria bacterium]